MFPSSQSIKRSLWLITLTAHTAMAAVWWWMMPSGFAVGDVNFWANQVMPFGVVAVSMTARFFLTRRPVLSASLLAVFPVIWLSSGLTAMVIFPRSIFLIWLGAGLFGLALAVIWMLGTPVEVRRSALTWMTLVLAALFGVWLPFTQRAKEADTKPLQVPWTKPAQVVPMDTRDFKLGPNTDVQAQQAEISFKAGKLRLWLQPTLQFISRSPDRGWVLFAKAADRNEPSRTLLHLSHDERVAELIYRQDFETTLHVERKADDVVAIESVSHLPEPIYSHLNTFTGLSLIGHRKLSVEFSSCPGHPIDFVYSDYPVGKPARFAYVDHAGAFHIVQATSAEKGPFHDLATGRLARGEPLEMTFCDDGAPVLRVRLHDWSAQASVQASPTAGYGVPVNAIEFSLQDSADDSTASVFITLAATSVGRGYQSVGHSAGTYRNRMEVEALVPSD